MAYPTLGLRGRTLGLLGCGKIGRRIAELGSAFGMDVIATVRDPAKQRSIETVSFEQLLADSDVIVIAAPANHETQGLFNDAAFAQMKTAAVLVNISRGAIIEDVALIAALDNGRIAAAGLDVFRREPPPANDPLLSHPRIVVSPHVAWGTNEAVERLLNISIDNVEAYLRGEPQNVVS